MSTAQGTLPPGPTMHRVLQTAGFVLAGTRFLEACRHRYGDRVYMRTLFDDGFVLLFDPGDVRELFRGAPTQLHAGEANAALGPIVGQTSVLLLDEEEHLRHRRLLLPAFHGRRLAAYEEVVRSAADAEIDGWPFDEEFRLLSSMQALTLAVIVRAVFGYTAGAERDELQRRLREMISPLARPRGLIVAAIAARIGRENPIARRFADARAAVDEILLAEVARRRADPAGLDERDDVFSALLAARDEQGEPLTDEEVRDELLTLLLAGHETTATALAWTLDLLLHTPQELRDAVLAAGEAGSEPTPEGDRHLDAVVKESLRIRPVIPGVGRVVRREPFRIGPYTIPPGTEINPSIRVIHRRADLYPEPERFRPGRFLSEDAPDTYTWLPFGGGTRRCLGASFATMEMRIVLRRILQRATLRPALEKPDETQFRAITLAPKRGVPVTLTTRRPR